MYLKELKIWNFRKYGVLGEDGQRPGITVQFHKNFNLLIGENDAGKTAIIDAIKLTLGTTSDDNIKITEEDFFSSGEETAIELKIECILSGLNDAEAGIFLEWLTFDSEGNYELQVRLSAKKQAAGTGVSERIDKIVKAGPEISSIRLEGLAREVLRTTYLKPLRNAEIELQPGIRSRLAQILKSHPAFVKKDRLSLHPLEKAFEEANSKVETFFGEPYSKKNDNTIQKQLNQYLAEFFNKPLDDEVEPESKFKVAPVELNAILRKLSLLLEDVPSGLGSLNLLFIAAELLLHNEELALGPNLTMIEEIEAHLHPQAQLRLIKYLQEKISNEGVGGQFILSTHSPTLAASTKLEHVILLYEEAAYPMGSEHTELNREDYEFLERFLDATKTNLFFAKGVIFVEGDAENLLLPTIAELMGRPLHKYGVSIVNIGNTAFKRYVKIYSRSQSWLNQYPESKFEMPVAMVTDLDVRPWAYYQDKSIKSKEPHIYVIKEETVERIAQQIEVEKEQLECLVNKVYGTQASFKEELLEYSNKEAIPLKVFTEIINMTQEVLSSETIEALKKFKTEKIARDYESLQGNIMLRFAKNWTLEYEIALSNLAILFAKVVHRIQYPSMDSDKIDKEFKKLESFLRSLSKEERAYQIYKPLLKKSVSKAIAAQYLASYLKSYHTPEALGEVLLNDPNLEYLRDAIYHVTGGAPINANSSSESREN